MKSSHVLAVLLAVGATAWILSGQLGDEAPATASEVTTDPTPERAPVAVRVADSRARDYVVTLRVTGRTEASRVLALRAETSGRIEELAASAGHGVEAEEVIARIAMNDRRERLARAEALVEQREIESAASAELTESGWRAQTADAAARTDLQGARAELAAVRLDIARTRIRAPFTGLLDSLDVEIGDVVAHNTVIGTLFDLDPILVVAAVSERDVGRLAVGTPASARLVTGDTIAGHVRFVGKVAEPATRTFRVELELPNPGYGVPAGVTADVELPLDTVSAHLLSPAMLALDDDGTLGVKVVDENDAVRFAPIDLVADVSSGVWVTGLPPTAALITVGQDYVTVGQSVEPVRLAGSSFSSAP